MIATRLRSLNNNNNYTEEYLDNDIETEEIDRDEDYVYSSDEDDEDDFLNDYDYQDDDIIDEEYYKQKKDEGLNIINLEMNKFDKIKRNNQFSLQSSQEKSPEYIDVIIKMYDILIEYDDYIMYNNEDSFNKLYLVAKNRLYHFITTIFRALKRPDLAFRLYHKYNIYFDMDFEKCFINIEDCKCENHISCPCSK